MGLLIQFIQLHLIGIISASIPPEHCPSAVDERLDCGFPRMSATECTSRECCWDPCEDCDSAVPWCFHPHYEEPEECSIPSIDIKRCGHYGIGRDECANTRCCWGKPNGDIWPWCYRLGPVPDMPENEVPAPVMPEEEAYVRYVYGTSGVLRLASNRHLPSSSSQLEGLVQIWHNGQWGTICDSGFSDVTAAVICRDFGETNGYRIPKLGVDLQYPILVEGLSCNGDESNVTECEHQPWGEHNCYHHEDIHLRCYTYDGTNEDEEGSLRMINAEDEVDGPTGILQIKHHGIWGLICVIHESEAMAPFLCRKLGYNAGTASLAIDVSPDYEPTYPVWLSYLYCDLPLDSLDDCLDVDYHESWGTGECYPTALQVLNCE